MLMCHLSKIWFAVAVWHTATAAARLGVLGFCGGGTDCTKEQRQLERRQKWCCDFDLCYTGSVYTSQKKWSFIHANGQPLQTVNQSSVRYRQPAMVVLLFSTVLAEY